MSTDSIHIYGMTRAMVDSEPPDIPLPDDVNLQALEEAMGFPPKFVVLPVAKADYMSRNSWTLTVDAVRGLVDQINEKRVGGIWGHVPAFEESFRFPNPSVRWLAATMDENGIAWAKAMPVDEETLRYFSVSEAISSEVATSIYADGIIEERPYIVSGLRLLTIDLGHPDKVAVDITSAVPRILSAITNGDSEMDEKKPEVAQNERSVDSVVNQAAAVISTQNRLEKLDTLSVEMNALREITGLSPEQNVVQYVRGLVERVNVLEGENRQLMTERMESLISERVRVESARPIIRELVEASAPKTIQQMVASVESVMSRPSVMRLLQDSLTVEAGGVVETPAAEKPLGYKKYVDIPEVN